MKVLLVNGSPHEKGCTNAALREIESVLKEEGIAVGHFWLGVQPLSGCIACGSCAGSGKCAVNPKANEFRAAAASADGFIFGSPVHYAAISGAMTSFMDCAFFSDSRSGGNTFYMKPAAAVLSARRAGTTAAFDQMNKYFTIQGMPVVSSCYWNMVHGACAEDVAQDGEGLYTMRTLGRNMAYILKCLEAGRNSGLPLPKKEQPVRTNFIR